MARKKKGGSGDPMKWRDWAYQFLVGLGHSTGCPKIIVLGGVVWAYHDHRWIRIDDSKLISMVHLYLMGSGLTADVEAARKVAHCIRSMVTEFLDEDLPKWLGVDRSTSDMAWLNMRGTLVNPDRLARGEDGAIRSENSSNWMSPVYLDYSYDPGARCDLWRENLARMLPPEEGLFLGEMAGYWLTADTRRHMHPVLMGAAGCGKSVIMKTLCEMLGGKSGTITNKLRDFDKNFGLDSTAGKLLNYVDECDMRVTPNTEAVLKSIMSGGDATTDRKYAQDLVQFRLTIRLAMCCNTFPKFKDPSDGLWRRLRIIKFPGGPGSAGNDWRIEEKYKGMLSGIFNWAIEGRRRLLSSGWTECGTSVEELAALKDDVHSPATWAKACIRSLGADKGFVSMVELYRGYVDWCVKNGLGVEADRGVVRRAILDNVGGVYCRRRLLSGHNPVYGIGGVSLTVDQSPN